MNKDVGELGKIVGEKLAMGFTRRNIMMDDRELFFPKSRCYFER